MATRRLAQLALMLVCSGTMASAAFAIPVQISFSGIHDSCTHSDLSFTFTCTGTHTDRDNSLYFHDGGSNGGNNDVVVTQVGNLAFRVVRFEWLPVDTASGIGDLTLSDQTGNAFFALVDQPVGTKIVDGPALTTLRLSTTVDAHLDDLVLEIVAVPEPTALSLVGLGALALLVVRRGRRPRVVE